MRLPYQALVLPFRRAPQGAWAFAVLRRPESGMWQFVAGGGETGETPLITAKREAWEEAGIDAAPGAWSALDSCASIPRSAFPGGAHWPASVYVVPEHCFAVDIGDTALRLSSEHDTVAWLPYDEAHERLTWDSNRVALWELWMRLQRNDLRLVGDRERGGASVKG